MLVTRTIPPPPVPTCLLGCPVSFWRILKEGWDEVCSNGGYLKTRCTEPQTIIAEIQPHDRANGGEAVRCRVNGLTLAAEHEFWYEPQDDIHLTTPASRFKTDNFDAEPFYGAWSVIRYLEQDWIVTELRNYTGGCADDHREALGQPISPCEDPQSDCNVISLQRGLLVPFKACIARKDLGMPDEQHFIDELAEWVRQP